MDRRRLKFVLLGGGIVAAMGFLLAVGAKREGGMTYYVTVTEFRAQPVAAKGLRVNGKVADGSIQRLPSGQDVRFVMTDGQSTLPVAYHGIIPDTFVEGADVVVEGAMNPSSGTFEAHNLLAKCPSKYEAAQEQGQERPHGDAPPKPAGANEG
jgi:cytochrome c-type biogenesis protein CcmE